MKKKEIINNISEQYDYFISIYGPIENIVDYIRFYNFIKPIYIDNKGEPYGISTAELILDYESKKQELLKLKKIKLGK